MADLERIVKVIFNGQDDVSTVLKTIGSNVENAGDKLSDFGAPFAAATEKVLLLDAAILGLAVAGISASSAIETETKKMAGALGLPTEEAEKFAEIARDVYNAGFGDTLADAFQAATAAQRLFSDESAEGLKNITTNALSLQEIFGVDYGESLKAVNSLMDNFGLTATEAFDFVASGFQKGLDNSGDFLESITEYGVQFKSGGATADEFFSVLKTGMSDGILGTDKAADAFKEFRVRIEDGSKTTSDALAQLGLGSKFTDSLASGEITAIQAFDTVIKKLGETENSSTQMQAAVGLLGTQFEDLGNEGALSINIMDTSLKDLNGSMASVVTATDTFENSMKSALRTVVDSFGDLTLWDTAKDKISAVFKDFAALLPEAFKNTDTSGLEEVADRLFNAIGDVFKNNDLDLTTMEGITNAIDLVIETIESIGDVTVGIVEAFEPILTVAKSLVEAFNSLDEPTKELVGNILGIGTELVVAGAALSAFGVAGSAISSVTSLLNGAAGLIPALSSISTNAGIGILASGAAGWTIGTYLRDLVPEIDSVAQGMIKAVDSVINFSGQSGNVDLENNFVSVKEAAEEATTEIDKTATAAEEAGKTGITFSAEIDPKDVAEIQGHIDAIKDPVEVEVDTKKAKEQLEVITASGEVISIEVDAPKLETVKKDVEEIPTEKQVEIQLQGDIDERLESIRQTGETMRTAFEWEAKLDIAELEADTKRIEAAFDSVDNTISSTGDTLSDLVRTFSGFEGSTADKWKVSDLLDAEEDRRNNALEMQKKLTDAQLEILEKQAKRLDSGEAMFTFDTSEIAPELELVLKAIAEKLQVWASESAQEQLFNLGL